MVYPELCDTIQNAIDEFYDAYPDDADEPFFYHRQHRLYDAVKIKKTKNDQDIEVLYGEEYFPKYPRVKRKGYMYDLIFINGYHGGARDGKTADGVEHPDGKTPYWKTPFPELNKWGSPAAQTESLESLVNRYKNDYFNNRVDKIIDIIMSDIIESYPVILNMFDIVYS